MVIGALVLAVLGFFTLRLVFSGHWILPQVFHLGPVAIRYYGLVLALAIAVGYFWAAGRVYRYGLTISKFDRVIFCLVVGGFVGARLYHVITEFDYYRYHLGQIFLVWQGGLSIFGAVLGGLISLAIVRTRLPGQSYLSLLDWLTPSLLLGQIIGRFGNLFNYELYGYPTTLPWKMFIPEQFRLPQFSEDQFFHPLFLYEALLNTIFFLILMRLFGSAKKAGTLFLAYLFLYNAGRFFLEFLRPDSPLIGSFRLNAGVSAALAVTGLAGLIYLHYASTVSPHS